MEIQKKNLENKHKSFFILLRISLEDLSDLKNPRYTRDVYLEGVVGGFHDSLHFGISVHKICSSNNVCQ